MLPENIQVAKTLFGNLARLNYVVGNAMELQLADESYDRVHCLEAAFHFPDRARFIREAYRVLRTGGTLVVVDFSWTTSAGHLIRDEEPSRINREIWQYDDFFSIDEYRQAARDAGFEVQSCRDWTRRVTKPISLRWRLVAWLGQQGWGRRLLTLFHPLTWGISDSDWRETRTAAVTTRQLEPHFAYMAYVFRKPRNSNATPIL